MSYIKDNFAPISFDSQKMEIAGIACLRKIASLKISPKIEKCSYQRSILKQHRPLTTFGIGRFRPHSLNKQKNLINIKAVSVI